MATPTAHRRIPRSLLSAFITLAALGTSSSARAQDVDLLGTWYVLAHYQDSATANPDAWRWDDRVWEFKQEGSRIRWTEYAIVVFNDGSGRFEGRHRVLAAWEPNSGQLSEIKGGLQVNSRGSKSKTVRPSSDGSRWASGGAASQRSAMVIGYTENWSVDDPTGLPDFTRTDSLGSGSEEDAGATRYTTTEVVAGGNELRGTFTRDGTRVGRFRLLRSGERRGLESAAKSAEERQAKEREAFQERMIEAERKRFEEAGEAKP